MAKAKKDNAPTSIKVDKQSKGEFGLGTVPVNYLKDGTDPSIKPDDHYPDWLWDLQVSEQRTVLYALENGLMRVLRCSHVDLQ